MNLLATILVLVVIAVAVVFAIVQMRRGGGGGCGACGACGGSSKGSDAHQVADESCDSVKDSRRVPGNKCASCSNHDCPFCN